MSLKLIMYSETVSYNLCPTDIRCDNFNLVSPVKEIIELMFSIRPKCEIELGDNEINQVNATSERDKKETITIYTHH